MEKVDSLKQKNVIIRHSKSRDINEMVQLSAIGFPGMDPFTVSHFKSHLDTFPQGQYCVEYEGNIIGSCSSMIINFNDYLGDDDYDKITSDGFIKNHNPVGPHLYGVDVVVHPNYRNMKIGNKLYEVRRNFCKQLNLKGIIFGGRIPSYYKYSHYMSAMEYVKEVIKGIIYDPALTFQLNQGFSFKQLIANYLPGDNDSLGFATLMKWENPDFIHDKDT